ncbi:MAG TPA: hypothetical protein VEN81_01845, partial [Planctomycetota bacterium]|nr:hypothetical protein [Planctomycetota bacterium]
RRIRAVGHPHLEGFALRRRRAGSLRRADLRTTWGLKPGEKLLCFASETYGLKYDRSYRFRPLSRSLERTVIILEHLLSAIGRISRTGRVKVRMINKIHPKNRPSEFRWLLRRPLPCPVHTVHRAENGSLVRAADLVVGMTSMFLTEATYLGAPVLHILPRPQEEGLLQDVARFNPVARDPGELDRQLRRMLDQRVPRRSRALRRFEQRHRGATGRIVRGVYGILKARNAFTKRES